MKGAAVAILFLTLWAPLTGLGAGSWDLVLLDSVRVAADQVLVADVAAQEVPPEIGDLVLAAGCKPGQSVVISRNLLLRKLVLAKLAAGVKILGASQCQVHFTGNAIQWDSLRESVQLALQALLPETPPEAPASWLELDIPKPERGVRGDWRIVLNRTEKLKPGRNLVRAAIVGPDAQENLTVQATLHAYGAVARAFGQIAEGVALQPELFQWEWVDLASVNNGLVVGSSRLVGQSLTRSLAAGDLLRSSDLRTIPVIQSGDSVELQIARGRVSVTVRACARQDGLLNQTIPVRNELTGRLVNARVIGPGLVEWRK